ncbi:hypothetical protein [Aliikangiella sp. IMCC44359]|uniref:hypothetical protein n=1 Tax=Aliikangiella sp. IMCC44359 TaxID=3459125 RepID=UPI00403B307D
MKKNRLFYLILSLLLGACSGGVKEQFEDSFFTYKDKKEKKHFSYILKLKATNVTQKNSYLRAIDEQGTRNPTPKQRVAVPENPEDARVSLKFRMEEIAHKKLKTKLDTTDYCPNGVKFEKDQFEDYRYKIKGSCLE